MVLFERRISFICIFITIDSVKDIIFVNFMATFNYITIIVKNAGALGGVSPDGCLGSPRWGGFQILSYLILMKILLGLPSTQPVLTPLTPISRTSGPQTPTNRFPTKLR